MSHAPGADDDDDDGEVTPGDPRATGQRLDKWLWYARVAKSRTLAAGLVSGGKVRINRAKVDKPSHTIKPGDVVTVSVGPKVRVLKMLSPGVRRGPATEARGLFDELTLAPERPLVESGAPGNAAEAAPAHRDPGSGRPTKRDRRQILNFKGGRR
ncbi:MAG: RNA-binding S4 domain-containing protein [Hyphomicrobiaceae bacterium]|nr:RNA-binding S4 domain-containing protein [Hyphomicrobiaceae bacterium]